LAPEKADDVVDIFPGKSALEIVFADLQRVVLDTGPDDLQTIDFFFEELQQGAILDSPVGITEDKHMGQVLESAGLTMGENDPSGLEKGPPFHLVQEGFDPVGRIIAVQVKDAMKQTMVPDL